MVVTAGRIEHLDISLGQHRQTVAGLTIGAISGAALGAIGSSPGGGGFHASAEGAAVVGVIGLVIGAGIGALIKAERWERVPGYPVAQVSVVQLQRGVGYGLALSF